MLLECGRRRPGRVVVNGEELSVVLYLVLTVAVFALLGTVLKLVERL
jgi:hypothetical protein